MIDRILLVIGVAAYLFTANPSFSYSSFFVGHTPVPSHPCHIRTDGPWLATMTVEYVRQHEQGAIVAASLVDGCICLVNVSNDIIKQDTIVLAGRQFTGKGYTVNGAIILERVLDL